MNYKLGSLLVTYRTCLDFCSVLVAVLTLILAADSAQATPVYSLGTTVLLESSSAGTDTVVLAVSPMSGSWTVTTTNTWLHINVGGQSGRGSLNFVFNYDSNPGDTRLGTLTIGDQTLTVTQAGATYVESPGAPTTMVSSGLNAPLGVAVDGQGNIYLADSGNNAIKKWTATNNTVATLIDASSLQLSRPTSVAVDDSGNVYVANNSAIIKWTAANQTITTLVSSSTIPGQKLNPGLGVDSNGNVYFLSYGNGGGGMKWTATNQAVTRLFSAGETTSSLAVDRAGNVYVAEGYNIEKWTALDNTLTTLGRTMNSLMTVSSYSVSLAVDGSGNVFIAERFVASQITYSYLNKWTAANSTLDLLPARGFSSVWGVAVDGAGNIYLSDTNTIKELPHALVNLASRWEGQAAGSDAVPLVLPISQHLYGPLAPTCDQSWLTLGSLTNGVLSFDFAAASGLNRTAKISLLGEIVPIAQKVMCEGPSAGSDSVVLVAGPWTASNTNTWLHLSAASQSGSSSANVVFSFDVNPGSTRTGTLTLGGQTVTVTQAGSTYVAATPLTTLVSSTTVTPSAMAIDDAGNIYLADTASTSLKKWDVSNNTLSTLSTLVTLNPLMTTQRNIPRGIAVDGAGNVFIADAGTHVIEKWTTTNSNLSTNWLTGSRTPSAVALDAGGNIYVAFSDTNQIWVVSGITRRLLVTLGTYDRPTGLAVDRAGNVYVAAGTAIKKWTAANNTLTVLAPLPLPVLPGGTLGTINTYGLTVDSSGNVYVAVDVPTAVAGYAGIMKWSATTKTLTTLPGSNALGMAVDDLGNLYYVNWVVAGMGGGLLYEIPRTFIDITPKSVGPASGNDFLPLVLPPAQNLRAPFKPTSDQPWLTISRITNGAVGFDFATNPGSDRTGNINLFGKKIPVTQPGFPKIASARMLSNSDLFQFTLSSTNLGTSFTVLTTTNAALPLINWTVVGPATNVSPGVFQFTAPATSMDLQRFFRVRVP